MPDFLTYIAFASVTGTPTTGAASITQSKVVTIPGTAQAGDLFVLTHDSPVTGGSVTGPTNSGGSTTVWSSVTSQSNKIYYGVWDGLGTTITMAGSALKNYSFVGLHVIRPDQLGGTFLVRNQPAGGTGGVNGPSGTDGFYPGYVCPGSGSIAASTTGVNMPTHSFAGAGAVMRLALIRGSTGVQDMSAFANGLWNWSDGVVYTANDWTKDLSQTWSTPSTWTAAGTLLGLTRDAHVAAQFIARSTNQAWYKFMGTNVSGGPGITDTASADFTETHTHPGRDGDPLNFLGGHASHVTHEYTWNGTLNPLEISWAAVAPTADISGVVTADGDSTHTFDGTGSTAGTGTIVSYTWYLNGSPTGDTGDTADITFANITGTQTVSLVVVNDWGYDDEALWNVDTTEVLDLPEDISRPRIKKRRITARQMPYMLDVGLLNRRL